MKIYSCMPNNDTVDFWIKNNLNVLFHGKHGVGKTSIIIDGFKRNNIKYMQFSAATMDPWVDFIGVPKEVKDDKGSYLDLIKPKAFRDDEVEALFFDELNRSHKKVRNAVMELIQFKSINGKKFPHLKMIWGAINPDNDEEAKYDVEKLDLAQSDRFQIHIEIPYKPYVPYFREKYGRETSQAAIDWWNNLPANTKLEISPRRLEYAIQIHKLGGNLLYVLPPYSNVDKLQHSLQYGSPIRDFRSLISEGDEEKIKNWLEIENNYHAVQSEIIKHPKSSVHLLSEEKLCSLVSISSKIKDYVFSNPDKFMKTIEELSKNSQNKKIQSEANNAIVGININTNGPSSVLPRSSIPETVMKSAAKIKNYKWNNTPLITMKNNARNYYNLDGNLGQAVASASKNPKQTPERIRICNSVIKIIYSASLLTESESKTALSIIDWVTNKTQTSSILGKTENLVQIINRCVDVIRKSNLNYKPKDFIRDYPSISGKLIGKCINNNNDWCIIPFWSK